MVASTPTGWSAGSQNHITDSIMSTTRATTTQPPRPSTDSMDSRQDIITAPSSSPTNDRPSCALGQMMIGSVGQWMAIVLNSSLQLMSNFEEKYLKALREIEEILKANRQMRDELDVVRTMRQAEIDTCTNIQNQEFRKAYDALLKDKNALAIRVQTLELDNERLKLTVSDLEHQLTNAQSKSPLEATPKADREAELRRTIENYEEHHATLQRNCKRLEERCNELEGKLQAVEKSWRIKLEAKDLQVVEVKARARQELSEQVSALRKENAALRLASSEAAVKLENSQQNALFSQQLESLDWEGDLIKQLTAVRSSLEPLRQQMAEINETDRFRQEETIRERAGLQARVLELQADGQRQAELISTLQKRLLQAHEAGNETNGLREQLKRLEQDNQLLNGRIIVMESREVALRTRTGEQLQQRVLQFESRIDLLLSNKEGLKELREVGIHQLIALKAYILELDSRLKELMLSNGYLLKKYKSYKEKYQGSLKEAKQQALALNTLKMKILGYDQLVIKLQGELQIALRAEPPKESVLADSSQEDLYRRKYELLQEKLQVQEKYKTQEMETFKLSYETKIMELNIKAEEAKSLRETLQLYRTKNQELQAALSKREGEIADSKVLTQSKITNEPQFPRISKDMIAGLHATIKSHDETIFRLQSELRTKEEAHRRVLRKVEKELEDAKENHTRDITRKELDFSLTLDQQTKKYKLRVAELEHAQQYSTPSYQGEEGADRLRILDSRLQAAQSAREEEMFNRRRLEKQLLDVAQDYDELQRTNNELELKLSQLRARQLSYDGGVRQERDEGHWEYQLQSKDAIIRKLNIQLREARQSQTNKSPAPSQKNDIYNMQKQIEQLKDTVARQTRQNNNLKNMLQASKTKLSSNLEAVLDEKQAMIVRLRRDLTLKQNKVLQFEQQAGKLSEQIRRFKRELSQIDRLKHEKAHLQALIVEKDRAIKQLRVDQSSFDVELDRLRQELNFVKENYQRLTYESLEKGDQISRLTLQVAAANNSNSQIETRLSQELTEFKRQYDRLSSECTTMKNTLRAAEEDRIFHQQNYRRASNDILSLRQEISEIKQENSDLRLQLSSSLQETAQLRAALERERESRDSDREREEEDYRIKTEFFTLKSDISNLKDQLFIKDSAIARLNKEISFLQTRNAELQEEVFTSSRLTFEYNALKEQYTVSVAALEERDDSIQRLNMELSTHWRKQRELEGELEYMNTNYTTITRQLDKNRTNLAYFQEEIEAKTKECLKLNNEIYNLKEQVTNLNEMLAQKQVQIGKIRQELITARYEANEREYEQKLRIERETYTLKAKITSLQNELDDKDEEMRRLQQKVTYRPESATIDIEVQEELRLELERTQRQLLTIRTQSEEYRHQYESLTQTVTTLRRQITDGEQALRVEKEALRMERQTFQKWKMDAQADAHARQVRDQQQFERLHIEIRQYQERISSTSHLQSHISTLMLEIKTKNEQVLILRQNLQQKVHQTMELQREMGFYKDQLNKSQLKFDHLAKSIEQGLIRHYEPIIGQMQANCRSLDGQVGHQQQLITQYEGQIHEYQQRIFHLSQQSQQLVRAQHQYEANIQQMHVRYSQDISQLRSQLKQQSAITLPPPQQHYGPPVAPSTLAIGVNAEPEDHSILIHPYLQQIERLNAIIRQLEEDLAGFKSKLFSMINHQNRLEQNLSNMVRLFNEVISVRQSIQVREAEIGEVRRSFVQKADSSGRSSRALESSGHQLVSSRELEGRSSLQGSLVHQGQVRGGPVLIKVAGSGHYETTIHATSNAPLSLPSQQQSLIQPVQTVRLIQQSPTIPPQGQLGGIMNIRPANYFIPGAAGSESQTGKRS